MLVSLLVFSPQGCLGVPPVQRWGRWVVFVQPNGLTGQDFGFGRRKFLVGQ